MSTGEKKPNDLIVTMTVAELRSLMRDVVREELVARQSDEHEVLTRDEVAELLQVHPDVVTRYVRNDGLPGAKVGPEWRFRRSQILHWLESKGLTPGSLPAVWGRKLKKVKEST